MPKMSKTTSAKERSEFKYDVSLSFAGEDRAYVDLVAACLRNMGISVFYDNYETINLWGKDLYVHLDSVYRHQARYCVLFISKHYARKLWTNHERQSAQARAFADNQEYILPVRFDETAIDGVRPTTGYINLRDTSPEKLATLIEEKVGKKARKNFLPPDFDILFKNLGLKKNSRKRGEVEECARLVFDRFVKLKPDERKLLLSLVLNSCADIHEDGLHMYLEVILRDTGYSKSKIVKLLPKLKIYGFDGEIGPSLHGDEEQMIFMRFLPLTARFEGTKTELMYNFFRTAVCAEYEDDNARYCSDCAIVAVLDGDFSQLSTSTVREFSVAEHQT